MEKKIDIQTILRDRMVFMCNSICHMLGEDMTAEEKAVVNEFDGGAEEYMKVYLQRDKFIVQNPMDLLSLPEAV